MDDEREEELSTLSSIYPELVRGCADPYKISLALQVTTNDPVTIDFTSHPRLDCGHVHSPASTKVRHLPPLELTATLPQSYPAECAPKVHLSTFPKWLPDQKLKDLEKEVVIMWQEYGCSQILFAYIDTLQQAVDDLFGLGNNLSLPEAFKADMVDYDHKQDKQLFESGSYNCSVCLDPKKGTMCHRMHSCGHVFCRACLQDYYNSAITEGDVVNIVCLDPSCGKDKNGVKKTHKHKKRSLHPRELLQIGLSDSQVRRFVELKRKKKVEADKSTVYCPRTWCQAPARSAKYRPIPSDLNDYVDSSDSESEAGHATVYTKDTPESSLPAPADRVTVCSKCSLAFCRVCYSTWHGEFARCWPRNPAELSEEEKASYDYIRLHTSPCPTCNAPVQKTMGCNHMACFQCNSHFCYLCSAWLDPNEPYRHFNNRHNSCYQRLWELEAGDEGPEAALAENQRRWELEARAIAALADEDERRAAQEAEQAVVQAEVPAAVEPVPAAAAPPAQVLPRPVQQRIIIRQGPPPGPIDPMHRLALRLEELRAQDGEDDEDAAVDGPPPPLGGAARARRRGRGRGRGQSPERGRGNGNRAGRPGRRARAGAQQVDPAPQPVENVPGADAEQALRRFIEMAARDEEDEWDSDELEDFDAAEWAW